MATKEQLESKIQNLEKSLSEMIEAFRSNGEAINNLIILTSSLSKELSNLKMQVNQLEKITQKAVDSTKTSTGTYR